MVDLAEETSTLQVYQGDSNLYRKAVMCVRMIGGEIIVFPIITGLHQGSALSLCISP